MILSSNDLTDLSNDELFDLLKQNNLNVGPVTPTTRSVYEKRLLKHLKTSKIPGIPNRRASPPGAPASALTPKSIAKSSSSQTKFTNSQMDTDDDETYPYTKSQPKTPPKTQPQIPREDSSHKITTNPPLQFKLLKEPSYTIIDDTNDIITCDTGLYKINIQPSSNKDRSSGFNIPITNRTDYNLADNISSRADYNLPENISPRSRENRAVYNEYVPPRFQQSPRYDLNNNNNNNYNNNVAANSARTKLNFSPPSAPQPDVNANAFYTSRLNTLVDSDGILINRKPLIQLDASNLFNRPSNQNYQYTNTEYYETRTNRATYPPAYHKSLNVENENTQRIYDQPPPPQPKTQIHVPQKSDSFLKSLLFSCKFYTFLALGLLFFIIYSSSAPEYNPASD